MPAPTHKPEWYLVPARIVLVTFLVTLLSFAVGLLAGILILVIRSRGVHPNMTIAYRQIALPAAIVMGSLVLIVSTALEVRHYRQAKALAGIANASR